MKEHHEGMRFEAGQEERAPVMQWVGVFLAPVTFFAHLQLGYVIIPWACVHDQDIWVHVVGIASVILAGIGCIAAWRTWMSGGRNVPGDHGGASNDIAPMTPVTPTRPTGV